MKNRKILNRRSLKKQHIIEFLAVLALIILLNILSVFVFYRIDLTSEKRFTLSDVTKNLLKNEIDDIVYFQVYLEGDFPAGFKRLSRETKEMLDEFRAQNKNIEYEFINPTALSEDKQEQNNIYKQLIEKGIEPTSLQVEEKGGMSQQLVFPGALVTYKGKEMPIQLLQSKVGVSPEEQLNISIRSLEYELSNVIRKLSIKVKKKIAFLEGHGELDKYETGDIQSALEEYYAVDRVRINGKLNALTGFDALIIASPDSVFSDKDKYVIDQFVMKGGKVLWFIDQVHAEMDSLRSNRNDMMGLAKNLDLDMLLFNYGAKIKQNLVMDAKNALPIPIQTGMVAGRPQYSYFPWFYFPLLMPQGDNPIVKNLDLVKANFASTIDTMVYAPGLKKEVLLTTSEYSRTQNAPAYITLDLMREKLDVNNYMERYLPVAVLLEGKFESAFVNRLSPEFMAVSDSLGYVKSIDSNKMLVVSDGSIIKNQVKQMADGSVNSLPLGYDMYSYGYTRSMFGNKNFVINAVNYLLDDSKLISVRDREVKLRLLDKTKVDSNRLRYQILNVVLPVLLVILFGFVLNFLKKRKYTKK